MKVKIFDLRRIDFFDFARAPGIWLIFVISFLAGADAHAQPATPGGQTCRPVSATYQTNNAPSSSAPDVNCRQPDGTWLAQADPVSPNTSEAQTTSTATPPAATSQSSPSTQASIEPQPVNPLTGPSFPCPQPEDPLAQLVCATPQLASLDMQFVQTYEALVQQVGIAGDPVIRKEDLDFDIAVRNKCGIGLSQASNPSLTPPAPAPPGSANCVIPSYLQQINLWKSMLQGPAEEEANRPIEEQVALQKRLQAMGFIPASSSIDGVFGTGTRGAIIRWQISENRPPTGLLGDDDAKLLLGQETQPAALAPSTGGGQASGLSGGDGQGVAPPLFSDPAGLNYVQSHETSWLVKTTYNEMTDHTDILVQSNQNNGTGAYAEVEGGCYNGSVTFVATIEDQNGNNNVNIQNEQGDGDGATIAGEIRYDQQPEQAVSFPVGNSSNSFVVAVLTANPNSTADNSNSIAAQDGFSIWRILAEVSTDHGDILVKIPVYDPGIEELIKDCLGTPPNNKQL